MQQNSYLSAELAEVFGVLTDLHLLDLFPQTGTISCACKTNTEESEKHIPETNRGRKISSQKTTKYSPDAEKKAPTNI